MLNKKYLLIGGLEVGENLMTIEISDTIKVQRTK